jgi:hypothetical protein
MGGHGQLQLIFQEKAAACSMRFLNEDESADEIAQTKPSLPLESLP